jgi:hypothetical protein
MNATVRGRIPVADETEKFTFGGSPTEIYPGRAFVSFPYELVTVRLTV